MKTSALDFNKAVLEKSYETPAIVEFSGTGCGPCLWVEKQLVEITRDRSGEWHFISLNLENHPELIDKYDIQSNPTVILFINGLEVGRLRGALPRMVVEQWIDDHIGNQTVR